MECVFELTLRTKDGRERDALVLWPTDEVRKDYLDKARKRGVEVEIKHNRD